MTDLQKLKKENEQLARKNEQLESLIAILDQFKK